MKTVLVIDAPDLESESSFWAAVYGTEAQRPRETLHVVDAGQIQLEFQLAPDHVAPQWPSGSQSQQMHLDIWVDDFPAAHQQVMDLGATLLEEGNGPEAHFQVYADPAGHPFCLCWQN